MHICQFGPLLYLRRDHNDDVSPVPVSIANLGDSMGLSLEKCLGTDRHGISQHTLWGWFSGKTTSFRD